MPDNITPTNAASSGIFIDRKKLKALVQRSDRPGLVFLSKWFVALVSTGCLVWVSIGTWWVWPAMFVYGSVLALSAYALSHETAHRTAFRTRWLNEMLFWISSLVYLEEPLHRRYTHTSHHTYTYHAGLDAQIPSDLPLTLKGWLMEVSGLVYYTFGLKTFLRLAFRKYSPMGIKVSPESELSAMTRNARIFLLVYGLIGMLIAVGQTWLLWFFVLPRLLGGITLGLFTILQHAETQVNSPSILESTRSFITSRFFRFFYMDMNFHIEHHLYPQVPFFSLEQVNQEISDQLPDPDPGLLKTHLELFSVVVRRTLGKNTRARSIRQADDMVTRKGYEKLARSTM